MASASPARDIRRFSLYRLHEAVETPPEGPFAADEAREMVETCVGVWAFARAEQALLHRTLERGAEARAFLARLKEERAFASKLSALFSQVRAYAEALPRAPGLAEALELLAPAEREAAAFLAEADPLVAKLEAPWPPLDPARLEELERVGRDPATPRVPFKDVLAEAGIDPREVGADPDSL